MERFDIFGSKISFRFQSKDVYGTKFGALITITLFCIVSVRLKYMIQNVIEGNEPRVLYQERKVNNPKKFNIQKNTFAFSIGIKDTNYKYYKDKRLFMVTGLQVSKRMEYNNTSNKREAVWEQTPFNFEECYKGTFDEFGLNGNMAEQSDTSHYCLPREQQLSIEGEFFSDNYSDIRVILKKCKGDDCYDESIINNILDNHYIEIVFTDSYFTPEQKQNPFKFYLRELFWPSSLNTPREINLYLRNNYIESDFGWFTQDFQTDIYPSFSSSEWQIVDKSSDFFFSATFRFEKSKENLYKRSYKKAISIMSELGGFTQILLTICFFLCSFYSQTDLNRTLINQTFCFEECDENNSQNSNQKDISTINNIEKLKNQKLIKQLYPNKLQTSEIIQNDLKENTDKQVQFQKTLQRLRMPLKCENTINESSKFNMQQSTHEYQLKTNENIQQKKQSQMNKANLSVPNLMPIKLNKTISDILYETKEIYYNKSSQQGLQSYQNSPLEKDIKKDIKTKESIFKQLINKTFLKINFSILKYALSFIFPFGTLKRDKAIFNYGINQLYKHLDMQYIINKLIEVDKLKKVLLDEDQIILLEYLPRPVIKYSYDENKQLIFQKNGQDNIFLNELSELEKTHNAVQSFENIMKKKKHSKLDYKIIQLLDHKLDFLFKDQFDVINVCSNFSLKQSFCELNDDSQYRVFNEKFQIDVSSINKTYNMENIVDNKTITKINNKF